MSKMTLDDFLKLVPEDAKAKLDKLIDEKIQSITPETARRNVAESLDLSEALFAIDQASRSGKLECVFEKGDSATPKPHAVDYTNGLKALGFDVVTFLPPYSIKISWAHPFVAAPRKIWQNG